MIIDIHGHYTTAPKALEDWRNRQIAGIKDPSVMPKVSELKISDDELRASIIENQLKKMQERGSDLTVFSPRASFNNEVGAPLTMLRVEHETRFLVSEFGASAPGAIAKPLPGCTRLAMTRPSARATSESTAK